MAVDTRYSHIRRRSQATDIIAEAPRDWRDWLIPGAVVGCLAYISLYHHATLADVVSRLF